MTFVPAIKSAFANYANFQGRASRSEYWWFFLFCLLVSAVLSLLSGGSNDIYNLLDGVFSLAVLVPSLALATRRLHDTNRSGWNQLWALTIIGIIPLIVWFATRGTLGPNRFGADPLPEEPAVAVEAAKI